jgi:hypothetical protein
VGGLDPSLNGPYARRGGDGNNYSDMLRFGVAFSDGARATNVRYQTPADGPPAAPYLRGMGGRGSTTAWSQGFWVWPLPSPGPLTFVCEWPAAGISQTRAEIDAQTIIDAGARAIIVFPASPNQRLAGPLRRSRSTARVIRLGAHRVRTPASSR